MTRSVARDADPKGTARLVLVTGGNRGLGAAIADAFRSRGDTVVATSRAGEGDDPMSIACDVRDEGAVDRAFAFVEDRFGVPDVVVANAGIAHRDLVMRMPATVFADVRDTNLTGAFLVAQRALPAMAKRRHGAFVFVSSVSGLWGTAGVAAYAASKAGLVGLSRSIAREMGGRGIRSNVVEPGLLDNATDLAPGADAWIAATPARRAGTLAETAAVVRFLASIEASGITGAVVRVDGGYAMGIT